jgi:hypothetical protein
VILNAAGVLDAKAKGEVVWGSNATRKTRTTPLFITAHGRKTPPPIRSKPTEHLLNTVFMHCQAAVRAANEDGWLDSYAIVRPGQLIGGPYDNNYYLGTIAKLDRPARSVLQWDDSPRQAVRMSASSNRRSMPAYYAHLLKLDPHHALPPLLFLLLLIIAPLSPSLSSSRAPALTPSLSTTSR